MTDAEQPPLDAGPDAQERNQLLADARAAHAPKPAPRRKGAENHHYVPRMIQRQFLRPGSKNQVFCYDMERGKTFTPNVGDIMGETRFNEFPINDGWSATFEPATGRIEDLYKATYEQMLRDRRILHEAESHAAICTLLAFQFLRTKAQRNRFADLDKMLTDKVESMGFNKGDIRDYEPLTKETLKQQHLHSTAEWLNEFSIIMSEKVFLLAEPPPGMHFYLGDNPVVLHNSNKSHIHGNLGLNVPGIEIYMPIAADLLLCAWCPSVLDKMHRGSQEAMDHIRKLSLELLMEGKITAPAMKAYLDKEQRDDRSQQLFESVRAGTPIRYDEETMKFQNSLQVIFAERFVIDKTGDFAMAKLVASDKQSGRVKGPTIRG